MQKWSSHVSHCPSLFFSEDELKTWVAYQSVPVKFTHCSWWSLTQGQNPRAQASGQMLNTLLYNVISILLFNSIVLNNLSEDYSDVKEILLPDWGGVKVFLVTRPRNSTEINSGQVSRKEGGSRWEFKKKGPPRGHPSPGKLILEQLQGLWYLEMHLKKIYLFIYLVVSGFSCGIVAALLLHGTRDGITVLQPGIEPICPASQGRFFTARTTREIPEMYL